MNEESGSYAVVVDINRGRDIRNRRTRPWEKTRTEDAPEIQRLLMWLEMLKELTEDIARKR